MSGEGLREGAGAVRRFNRYPAYKDSGVEWLGEIPMGWEVRRLKYLAALNSEALPESTDPTLQMLYVDIGGVDSLGRIVGKEHMTFASAPSRARRVVRDGDVIVSTVRTYLRAIALISEPEPGLIVSTGFAVVRPDSDFTTRYAAYALRTPYFVERVVANSNGVSFPAISETAIATYELAMPSVSEQRAIAAFLARETARIDELVAKKERLIDLLAEKRSALITQAVTQGLDPKVPMKDSGVEWLGEIPANWEVAPLKRRWKVVDCLHLTPTYVPDGFPLVSTSEVKPGRLDLTRTERFVSRTDFDLMTHGDRAVTLGDIVYSRNASLGSAAYVDTDEMFCMGQDVVRITSQAFDQLFLTYVLNSPVALSQVAAQGLGSTFKRINVSDIKMLLIPVPPAPTQRRIASFLDRETAKLDALTNKVREAIDRLRELRTALISTAVTGQIDVRGAAPPIVP